MSSQELCREDIGKKLLVACREACKVYDRSPPILFMDSFWPESMLEMDLRQRD